MAIAHLAVIDGNSLVYVDARDEYLTADQARRQAIKLLELAQQAEHPKEYTEWP